MVGMGVGVLRRTLTVVGAVMGQNSTVVVLLWLMVVHNRVLGWPLGVEVAEVVEAAEDIGHMVIGTEK